MLFKNGLVLASVLVIAACQSTKNGTTQLPLSVFPVVTPKQLPLKYEQELAQLNILLAGFDSEEDKQAYFLYRRAVRYDQIGLHRLAERDFSTVVKLVPQFSDAYLHLGIYSLNRLDFEYAYQHFDSVLELAPDNTWAYLNRGIALYYGSRFDLSVADFDVFEAIERNEHYVVLWKYLAMQQQNTEEANQYLRESLARIESDKWVTLIAKMFLSEVSTSDYLSKAKGFAETEMRYAELLCEGYFYLGKHMQHIGDAEAAEIFFTLSTTPNVTEMVEHRLSLLELRLLEVNN